MSELRRTLLEDVFYPPHDPRTASAEYRRTHHKLIVELDEACWICGIRHSQVITMDAADRDKWQLETHHDELEWAAASGVDLAKITADFPAIMADPQKLRDWLDSEGNMLVLCATHHRGSRTGVHCISYPAWKLQRYQVRGGWQFITQPQDLPGEAFRSGDK